MLDETFNGYSSRDEAIDANNAYMKTNKDNVPNYYQTNIETANEDGDGSMNTLPPGLGDNTLQKYLIKISKQMDLMRAEKERYDRILKKIKDEKNKP